MSHRCLAKDCAKTVADEMAMCYPHWRLVPRAEQRAVWNAYENYGKLSPPHVAALDAAIAVVARREGKGTP